MIYPSGNFYSENFFHICEVDEYNCTIGGYVFLIYKIKKPYYINYWNNFFIDLNV